MPTLPFPWSPRDMNRYDDLVAARLADGSFVVAWTGQYIVNQRGISGSFFQRFSALGLEIGDRVVFSIGTGQIDLTALADGGFAIASLGSINQSGSVFRFDLDGVPVQTKFLPAITQSTTGFGIGQTAVAGLEFGGFVLTQTYTIDNVAGVALRHFDVLGRGRPVQLLEEVGIALTAAAILPLEDGGYRLFLAREMEAGVGGAASRSRVVQRDFDMNGDPVSGVSAATLPLSTDGAITRMHSVAAGGGNVVLILQTEGGEIMMQVLAPTGARLGGTVTVAQDAASFDVRALAGGGFVLAHNGDGAGEVLVQRYLPDGTAFGPTFAAGLDVGSATAIALVDLEGGGFALFGVLSATGRGMIFDQGSDRADFVVFETPAEFNGAGGTDFIVGSPFADALGGGSGADIIKGRGGDDFISLGNGRDDVWERGLGGSGNDVIRQGDGASRLFGGAGNDALYGGDGLDQLSGADGDDALYGGAGDDTLVGDDGADLMRGGEGADLIFGGAMADRMIGDAGDDRLFGGDGSDALFGGAGDDSLIGGAGNDRLFAGAGDDTLNGGSGNDRFLFTVLGSGNKTITDFRAGDLIGFRDADRAVRFADLEFTVTGATTTIALAGSDFTITLLNMAGPLGAGDFLF